MYCAHDTIAAPATAAGGAIAVLRISGPDAIGVCDRIFRCRESLAEAAPRTVQYGWIVDGDRTVDEVLVVSFHAPHSYTGEDTVEISCHGSSYIVSEILRLLSDAGARIAEPGEFTIRAFLAGKMDLAQAEAVGDLIASSSRAAHTMATAQMRGGFSEALRDLRGRLLQLTSLLELELDFSEEDVEFADRAQLQTTMEEIEMQIETLRHSFALGNALKHGVAVAIIGEPNVGKSTLLNRLLGEDRAMVSDVAGTTRDAIEETVDIDGVLFRFIDTAGLRHTDDRLERMGIERTLAAAERAQIILHLTDAASFTICPATGFDSGPRVESQVRKDVDAETQGGAKVSTGMLPLRPGQQRIEVVNKIDTVPCFELTPDIIGISARKGTGIDRLRAALRKAVDTSTLYHGDPVVSSARHYAALSAAREALDRARKALAQEHSADLLSEDIRDVLHHLGTITDEITTDEVLQNIFSKFCIGK